MALSLPFPSLMLKLPIAQSRQLNGLKQETEQLLHEKRSKCTNKATDNAVGMLRDLCKSKIWTKASKNLAKQSLTPCSGNLAMKS